jgi:hypothetical protein
MIAGFAHQSKGGGCFSARIPDADMLLAAVPVCAMFSS